MFIVSLKSAISIFALVLRSSAYFNYSNEKHRIEANSIPRHDTGPIEISSPNSNLFRSRLPFLGHRFKHDIFRGAILAAYDKARFFYTYTHLHFVR